MLCRPKKIKQDHTAQKFKREREREREEEGNNSEDPGEYGDSEAKQTKYF